MRPKSKIELYAAIRRLRAVEAAIRDSLRPPTAAKARQAVGAGATGPWRCTRSPPRTPTSLEAISANPAWAQHRQDTADVAEACHDDLAWADAVLFGTPTRFGNPACQLRQFIDTTGPQWYQGKLADKVYSAFTASNTAHGGQESTLLALGNTFYHWGGIIVPPGYTDPIQFQSGNP
ncbi:NAD(P)H-dependent oxidoreductase [Nonomuraea sp. NPDC049152]|uniref:NAD(P)H-dependent oxidoreductase n=1 Tax=Nonomuraea sp. NPDC049152 TaxID=3154350 RepID=UPI0033C208CA